MYALLHWMDSHERFFWRVYNIFFLIWDFVGLVLSSWSHITQDMIVMGCCMAVMLLSIHRKRDDGGDDDQDEDLDPDYPTGDAIDRWLRSRTLVPR
jgi:hypothetical protein